MKVFDCFQFFNEIELLELRLMELNPVVDYFVIAESNKTHRGYPKEFIFENNKEIFSEYLHKIIYVKITDLPDYSSNDIWKAENFQRNALMRGLADVAQIGDKIIVSDLDEIPNTEGIIANLHNSKYVSFRQKLYYYYVNCLQNQSWIGTIMANFGSFNCLQDLRNYSSFNPEIYENGGWHYSYMGGAERIKLKVEKAVADGEQNVQLIGSIDDIAKNIEQQKDIFGRTESYAEKRIVDISNDKPKKLDEFLKKYPHFFYNQ